ncbi:hypothetical protein JTB14_020074 [Gonioctena quinquepunctata]|nr:hypothetical protein JTB14_020074 [Gonioctena quinquepunctata]
MYVSSRNVKYRRFAIRNKEPSGSRQALPYLLSQRDSFLNKRGLRIESPSSDSEKMQRAVPGIYREIRKLVYRQREERQADG